MQIMASKWVDAAMQVREGAAMQGCVRGGGGNAGGGQQGGKGGGGEGGEQWLGACSNADHGLKVGGRSNAGA
jgi:hypothetical protein